MLFVTRHFKPVCIISVLVYLSNCNLLMQYSSVTTCVSSTKLYICMSVWFHGNSSEINIWLWETLTVVINVAKGAGALFLAFCLFDSPPPSIFPIMVALSKLFSKNDATSPTCSFLRCGLNLVTVPELSFTDNKRKPWKWCLRSSRRVALKKI